MEDSWVVDAGLSGDATLGVDPRSGKGVGCDFGVEEGDRDELIKLGDLRCWSSRQRGEASGDALVGLEDVSVGITGVVTVLQPSVIRFFRVVTITIGWELWVTQTHSFYTRIGFAVQPVRKFPSFNVQRSK